MKFFFNSSESNEALLAKKKLIDFYGQNNIDEADVIIPIGGDGFLWQRVLFASPNFRFLLRTILREIVEYRNNNRYEQNGPHNLPL